MSQDSSADRPKPRERIVDTARDLFHRHGIRNVGVDSIAEAAQTNKMTLYRHFTSKDALIVETLNKAAQEAEGLWHGLEVAYPGDPMAQLRAWLGQAAQCIIQDSRGCDMANAAVELTEDDHPARRVIEEFKTMQRNHLATLCKGIGVTQPDLLADALFLLLEGARVSRQSIGAEGPVLQFVRMGEIIIASFKV